MWSKNRKNYGCGGKGFDETSIGAILFFTFLVEIGAGNDDWVSTTLEGTSRVVLSAVESIVLPESFKSEPLLVTTAGVEDTVLDDAPSTAKRFVPVSDFSSPNAFVDAEDDNGETITGVIRFFFLSPLAVFPLLEAEDFKTLGVICSRGRFSPTSLSLDSLIPLFVLFGTSCTSPSALPRLEASNEVVLLDGADGAALMSTCSSSVGLSTIGGRYTDGKAFCTSVGTSAKSSGSPMVPKASRTNDT
mmetsp:Transcript_16212/g.24424  ORF Transcript_16212/g.24424 Transcript_16212/m.24424 type:complete len:246 (-) Transcript_16212:878-1615(-)